MKSCITKHGEWKWEKYCIKIIMQPIKSLPKTIMVSPKHTKYWLFADFCNIKFYDTKGNYTGFRLKSLK